MVPQILAADRAGRICQPGRVDVTIRRAGPADADAVSALYLRARRVAAARGSIPPPGHTDEEVARWIMYLVIPRRDCWVAERRGGDAAGILVLDGEWIEQLYVDPDLTGRGIGTALLDLAKRERPQRLRLWTFAANAGAQRFYERHGFTEVERTTGDRNEERAPDIQYLWEGAPA